MGGGIGMGGGRLPCVFTLFVQLLAIEGLAEAPARVAAAKGLEADRLLFACPLPVLGCRGGGLDAAEGRAGGGGVVGGEEGGLDAFEEDLVVDARLSAAAEGDGRVHEVWVLGRPLEALAGAHGPARHAAQVRDVELLGEEGVLGADVVVEGHVGEGGDGGVGRGGGLPVAEERCDDDEVFLWIQGLVFANEPFVVGDCTGVPARVEDCWRFGVAKGLVCDPGTRQAGAALQLEVTKVVG